MKIASEKIDVHFGDYILGKNESSHSDDISFIADDYKTKVAQNFTPLDPKELLNWKLNKATWSIGDNLYCSIKVDGQTAILYYDKSELDEKSCFVTPFKHRCYMNLPVNKDIEEILNKSNLNKIFLAGELFIGKGIPPDFESRSKIYDFLHYSRNPSSQEDLERIGFKVFDLIMIDGENWIEKTYSDRYNKLKTLIPESGRFSLVETQILNSVDLFDYYNKIVAKGHEGIIIRNSETFRGYKVKPIHTIDCVIIGVVEGVEGSNISPGMLSSALVAVQDSNGRYIILSKVGSGLTDEYRKQIWSLIKFANQPNFVAATSDGRSYQMVKPEIVVEIEYLDIISETTLESEIRQLALNYNEDSNSWDIIQPIPFVSLISPRFCSDHPIREDKTPTFNNIRINQVLDLVDIKLEAINKKPELPKSQVLARYVFVKNDDMIRKFLVWKTNKHEYDKNYLNYVIYYLDYSANRKELIKRSVIITNDLNQMWKILDDKIKDEKGDLKRGWRLYSQLDNRETTKPIKNQTYKKSSKSTKSIKLTKKKQGGGKK